MSDELRKASRHSSPKEWHIPEYAWYRVMVVLLIPTSLVTCVLVLVSSSSLDAKLLAATGLLGACLLAMFVAEWRARLKYKRLYEYEKRRRINSDKAFIELRGNLDEEIVRISAIVSPAEESEVSDDPDEMSAEMLRGYLIGLEHGKELTDSATEVHARDPEERPNRHLKLVKNQTEEAS